MYIYIYVMYICHIPSPGTPVYSPLQYSCLENPMDIGAWWATVCGVSKSCTRLSDFSTYMLLVFSRSVVSDSLQLHGLQHARPPCPSPAPRVYSNSCPSSRWCIHLILCFSLFVTSIFPSIRVFSHGCMQWGRVTLLNRCQGKISGGSVSWSRGDAVICKPEWYSSLSQEVTSGSRYPRQHCRGW